MGDPYVGNDEQKETLERRVMARRAPSTQVVLEPIQHRLPERHRRPCKSNQRRDRLEVRRTVRRVYVQELLPRFSVTSAEVRDDEYAR